MDHRDAQDPNTNNDEHGQGGCGKFNLTLHDLSMSADTLADRKVKPDNHIAEQESCSYIAANSHLSTGTVNTTITTDPEIKVFWGPDTSLAVYKYVLALARHGKLEGELSQLEQKGKDDASDGRDNAGARFSGTTDNEQARKHNISTPLPDTFSITSSPLHLPLLKPPPPTPPEQAHHPALSTPTLPTLHSFSDPVLVAAFREEREQDPISFDAKTRDIRRSLIAAKVERGGKGRLSQGDYSVELASREDAVRVEKWATTRRRAATLTQDVDSDKALAVSPPSVHNHAAMEDHFALKGGVNKVTKPQTQDDKAAADLEVGTEAEPGTEVRGNPVPELDDTADHIDLTKQTVPYTSSGNIRHHITRTTEDTDSGHKVTIKTSVEIIQEIFVPHPENVGWEDLVRATRQMKVDGSWTEEGDTADEMGSEGDSQDEEETFHDAKENDFNSDVKMEVQGILAGLKRITQGV